MRYNVKKKHLRKLARLWLRDYEAATPAEREEMVEAAEEVYTGMDHYLELRNIAEQGGIPHACCIVTSDCPPSGRAWSICVPGHAH